jgi:transposase
MYNCSDWIEGNIANKLFPSAQIKSQDISRLINMLGKQEMQQLFFKNYVSKFFPEKTGLLIDSTALPSAINSSINAFGYTPDGIKENVTCLMLVDKASKLPIYFRAIGGDISDNSTLKTTIIEIKKLGLTASYAILDAGYCSKDNINYLCKEDIDFVTRLPKSHSIFYQLIDEVKFVESRINATKYGDRVVFIEVIEKKYMGTRWLLISCLILIKKQRIRTLYLRVALTKNRIIIKLIF